jgi:ribonuclease HII
VRSAAVPSTAVPAAVPGWTLEAELWEVGHRVVAGIDEAGRGALAGPVVVAVVVLPVTVHPFVDSKTVGPEQRELLAALVRERALIYALVESSASDVDRIGVLAATLSAAERGLRALAGLEDPVSELVRRVAVRLDGVVTDYLRLPLLGWTDWDAPTGLRHPPRADGTSCQVAAASLLAKTHRDAVMRAAAVDWPQYGFEQNKGYGVPAHLSALEHHGPCPLHRRSFRPVAAAGSSWALALPEVLPCPTPSA